MSIRAGFCVSGHGSLFRAAVRRHAETGAEPALLVLETKSAGDLEDFAAANGVPSVRLDPRDRGAFDAELARHLGEARLDLVVLTFDRILPPAIVAAFPQRIVNVHPSLLPAFAGNRGIERTLESGVRIGGATIHEVVDAVDAGAVIAQAALAIAPDDTPQSYGARLYALLEPMFLQVLRWYAEGRVSRDGRGRLTVRGARYDALPVVPALEAFAP
ncbi:MAG TPA: formyltransferase family protein [Thermoanaerobaculia bacterium]|nr:formyltransferase family protein [Thermoanaerobaculia bacterium]